MTDINCIKMLGQERLLGEMVENRAKVLPDHPALIFYGQNVTYRELNKKAEALATSFLRLGLKSNDRIAVILPTRPEFLYVWLAASKIGASVVGLNVRYRENEIVHMINDASPSTLVCINEFAGFNYHHFLIPLLPKIQSVNKFIFLGPTEFPESFDLEKLLLQEPDSELLAAQKPDDIADNFMIYTSGSTGRPKGAVLTQKSILAMIRPWAANLMLKNEDRLLLVLPLNHVGGGTICAMTSLASGATSVMHDMFLPDIALSLIDEQKITILAGVPTMYAMIFSLPSFDKRTLNSVRTAVYGGAAAPPELLNKMNTLMICRIIGTYGSTEVSGFCTYTTAEDSFDTVLTTVGKPPKSINIKIVDPVSRAALNTGQIGEVAIKGDLLIDRYLNMPEETRLVFDNEGWFFSGDMGCLNQEGYLTLAGRLKEMYITGGFNVYPKEIEDILAEHPAVAMAAVIGVPDDIKGETGWAFVMKVPGSNVTVDDLTKYCKEKMANYKVPSKIFIEDTLPMTSLGKVHKPTLKELYGKIS